MRPFWALTKREINHIYASRREIKRAWEDLRQHSPYTDSRGIRRGIFILGWLACAQHYHKRLEEQVAAVTKAATLAAQKEQAKWITTAHLGDIDWVDEEPVSE